MTMLKKGSVGKDVVILQNILGIKPDGEFGLITEEAVKNWQVKNRLTSDGVIKNNEWIKMGFANSILKLDVLKTHIPETVILQIPETAAKFNINNILRLSHFLAQCGHESGGFRVVVENLNYSAPRLKEIFPKYFPNSLNESYAKQPKKIANKVYANRMGNGNELSGDGYKFRGRGYIQLTGMSNYAAFDKIVNENILLNPELVATKYPLMSAAFFFDVNKIWNICDRGSTDTVVTAVTKKVNGGTIGLADRIKHFKKYYTLLNK
jgi:putative chitinase